MTFTKILCPIDFSPGSQQALRAAVQIANETDADLVIAHVWYVPVTAFGSELTVSPMLIQPMMDDAQRELDAAVREASARSTKRVVGTMPVGVPWAEIASLLEREAFDLCVIGTHGRTGMARVVLGSVAEKVVRHAPCPVLAVRPDGVVKPFEHVLVPTDFSTSAAHALDLAARVVRRGGRATLLHVVELPAGYAVKAPELARDLERRVADALDRVAAPIKEKARVDVVSRLGAPGVQILAALDEDPSIDLVVMGSHGRTGIKRALIGSVAEKVVRHARCPVLVARNGRA